MKNIPSPPIQPYNRRQVLRQNMMAFGLENMPPVDVIELVLYYTLPIHNAQPIAQELLNRFGTIERIAKASSTERKSIPGIGSRTDEHFAMIAMFIPYVLRNRFGDFPVFCNINALKEFCIALHVMHEYEVLYLLCLNAGNRLIKKEIQIALGMPGYLNVELKHIMDAVANTATVKVVLCHNHPSGVLHPSHQDIQFNKTVQAALSNIQITLFDHIIVADNSAVSMKEMGLIQDGYVVC